MMFNPYDHPESPRQAIKEADEEIQRARRLLPLGDELPRATPRYLAINRAERMIRWASHRMNKKPPAS